MVNWDDWIQCEEDSEMLIYEEWQRYVDEINRELEEEWINQIRCTD